MAANYKVNIELDTKKLDKQLKQLGVKVDKVGKVKQSQSKKTIADGDKEIKQEQRKIALQNQFISNATQAQKISSKMVDFDKTKNLFAKTKNDLQAGELDLAKKGILLTKQDILQTQKLVSQEKKVTAEKVKQVNLQSAGMNLIRLSGKAGKLGGRTAAVIDQQTAMRQPKGLPSAAMLNAEARGIQRLGTTPSIRGLIDPSNPQISGYTASSAKKAAFFENKINKARLRGIENNKNLIGSEVLRNKQTIKNMKFTEQQANAEARRLNQALRNPLGPSSPLNFRGNQLLPGPAGSGRGGGLTSALISGAFPLLFGQGPLAAAGGFTGGLVGDRLGGQMGGFAGGLIGTAIVTSIQGFVTEVGKLGSALNDATKDITAVSAALGITGTEFEKNLKTLEKLGGEEEAFEAARAKMISLVGQEGVTAMQNFGKGTTELANQFTIAMTQMKAGLASFLQGTGAGRFLLDRMTSANLVRQSKTSKDPEVVRAREIADAFNTGILRRSKEERQLVAEGRELGFNNYFDALKAVEEAQKRANQREEEAAVEKLMADIQKQRVKNISDEIKLLEQSFGLTSDEFEIEKQIMQMKQDGEIKDENEIRNKLKHLQNLQKERQLAEETAAAFERMSQTIATDISDGIKGMIRGTSTLNDVLNSVLNKLVDAAFNMAMFGNMQGSLGGGGFFGILGGLFSGGGGGGALPPSPIYMAANGGRIPGGRPSLVGEKGPELFTPATGGYVTPNHELGGSTNIVVNVDASGSSVEGDEQRGRELGRLISVAVQSELIQQKRPGGLLA